MAKLQHMVLILLEITIIKKINPEVITEKIKPLELRSLICFFVASFCCVFCVCSLIKSSYVHKPTLNYIGIKSEKSKSYHFALKINFYFHSLFAFFMTNLFKIDKKTFFMY